MALFILFRGDRFTHHIDFEATVEVGFYNPRFGLGLLLGIGPKENVEMVDWEDHYLTKHYVI